MDHAATPIPIVDLVSAATDSSCHAGVTTSMNASWPLLCYYHLSHITYPTKLKGIRELSAAVGKYRGSITWAWSHSTSISMCPFHPIHSIYIYPFSQKPPRQKEAHQSSFFKFTLHPMPRSSMVSLKQVRMAEKFTTIHYDSDAAGDAYTGLAGLSKSFGKYRLAK